MGKKPVLKVKLALRSKFDADGDLGVEVNSDAKENLDVESNFAANSNIKVETQGKLTDKEFEKLCEAVRAGKRGPEPSKILNKSRNSVDWCLRLIDKQGLIRAKRMLVEGKYNTYSDEQLRSIALLKFQKGLSAEELEVTFGTCRGCITRRCAALSSYYAAKSTSIMDLPDTRISYLHLLRSKLPEELLFVFERGLLSDFTEAQHNALMYRLYHTNLNLAVKKKLTQLTEDLSIPGLKSYLKELADTPLDKLVNISATNNKPKSHGVKKVVYVPVPNEDNQSPWWFGKARAPVITYYYEARTKLSEAERAERQAQRALKTALRISKVDKTTTVPSTQGVQNSYDHASSCHVSYDHTSNAQSSNDHTPIAKDSVSVIPDSDITFTAAHDAINNAAHDEPLIPGVSLAKPEARKVRDPEDDRVKLFDLPKSHRQYIIGELLGPAHELIPAHTYDAGHARGPVPFVDPNSAGFKDYPKAVQHKILSRLRDEYRVRQASYKLLSKLSDEDLTMHKGVWIKYQLLPELGQMFPELKPTFIQNCLNISGRMKKYYDEHPVKDKYERVLPLIITCFNDSHRTFGKRRMCQALRQRYGIYLSIITVKKLMDRLGLVPEKYRA